MSTSTATTPNSVHVTGWDRGVVIALGGAGCALSYDALQQMAVAIHVRGLLTYLFPLVIDGFIAYGVRALLVMRDAPLRARMYVWLLFGTATGASLWANALHAVRMNEQSATTGLRLGDSVVAVLSTIAPLALAGAVHLYILIARGPVGPADRDGQGGRVSDRVTEADRGQVTPDLGQVSVEAGLTERLAALTSGQDSGGHLGAERPVGGPVTAPGGQPVTGRQVSDRPADSGPVTIATVSLAEVTDPPVTDRDSDRRPDLDTEDLLAIARKAAPENGRLTRKVVAEAIRGQKIPLSSATLTELMAQLRPQPGQPVTADRN
ncbi:DUF2637 domain-containing protein [Kitasatospora brasiliensis]|uniref:DUF2637 domain-containing protein n=1 Tax=Kitasatospora brasiliensis TaxID=3058040 RepID=UPI00292D7E3B|nr:DUF2637 domain-containing protein [Kitasatospora sp. K002]